MSKDHLLDYSIRRRIYDSQYWKQYCFGLNLVSFIDRSQLITAVGGVYGIPFRRPTHFLCLFLKLLELNPSNDVVEMFLNTKSWQMKYLQLLTALFIRFTWTKDPDKLYNNLELLLSRYNKFAVATDDGYIIKYFDEIIYDFLNEKTWYGINLPPIPPRSLCKLPERYSELSILREKIRIEEFARLGMNENGELINENTENHKSKKLIFKKKKNKVKHIDDKEKEEIDEENRIRASLGLKLLQ